MGLLRQVLLQSKAHSKIQLAQAMMWLLPDTKLARTSVPPRVLIGKGSPQASRLRSVDSQNKRTESQARPNIVQDRMVHAARNIMGSTTGETIKAWRNMGNKYLPGTPTMALLNALRSHPCSEGRNHPGPCYPFIHNESDQSRFNTIGKVLPEMVQSVWEF